MFCVIRKVFIALSSISGSSATKYVSLHNKPCMIRPTLIDLNPIELNHYPFMISLDKCMGSCSNVDGLSSKIYVPSKTKDVIIKVFKIIKEE